MEDDILTNVNSDIIDTLNDDEKANIDNINPKVSIIVPVYNTDKYITKCMDSILNQTFKNIEIICINDGSTDDSLRILRGYEKKYPFIKIISQKNKGLSASRNVGLDNVSGKYVYFLDSDDFLESTALSELYRISEDECLDMVMFKLINYDEASKKKYSTPYFDIDYLTETLYNKVFNYKDLGRLVYRVAVTMQSTFFNFDLISNLRFIEGVIFEDNPFFIEALFNSNNVYFYDEYLCNKVNRQSSIVNSSFKKFSDCIFIANQFSI